MEQKTRSSAREVEREVESAVKIHHASELADQHVLTFDEPAHGAKAVRQLLMSVKATCRSQFKNTDKKMLTCTKRWGEHKAQTKTMSCCGT